MSSLIWKNAPSFIINDLIVATSSVEGEDASSTPASTTMDKKIKNIVDLMEMVDADDEAAYHIDNMLDKLSTEELIMVDLEIRRRMEEG